MKSEFKPRIEITLEIFRGDATNKCVSTYDTINHLVKTDGQFFPRELRLWLTLVEIVRNYNSKGSVTYSEESP